jgi:hypothetical protein
MLGSGWFAMLKVLAAILCVFGILSFALIYFIPAPPSTITIASGFTGGNYERIAARYQKVLARHHVTLEMRGGSGGVEQRQTVTGPEHRRSGRLRARGNGKQRASARAVVVRTHQLYDIFYLLSGD